MRDQDGRDDGDFEQNQFRTSDYKESNAVLTRQLGAKKGRITVFQSPTLTASGSTGLKSGRVEPNPHRVGFHIFFNGSAGILYIGMSDDESISATRFSHFLAVNASWGNDVPWRYTGAIYVAFSVDAADNRAMVTEVMI